MKDDKVFHEELFDENVEPVCLRHKDISEGVKVIDSLLRCFSIIYRQGSIIRDKAIKAYGLTGQQMGYLRYIHEHRGTSQESIAKTQCIDKGSVAKSIKYMIEKGYIQKESNPDDRRAYRLSLTEKGEDIYEDCAAEAKDFEKILMKGFTEEETRDFTKMLGMVTDNILNAMEEERL